MSIKFQCPYCGQKLEAAEDWVGNHAQCPSCQNDITIIQQQDQPNISSTNKASENLSMNQRKEKTGEKQSQEEKGQVSSQSISTLEFESAKENKCGQSPKVNKKYIGIGSIFIIIIVLVIAYMHTPKISVSEPKISVSEPKISVSEPNDTIDIFCHFYTDRNEKIVPYCEFSLGQGFSELVRVFSDFVLARNEYLAAEKKVYKLEAEKAEIDDMIDRGIKAGVDKNMTLEMLKRSASIFEELVVAKNRSLSYVVSSTKLHIQYLAKKKQMVTIRNDSFREGKYSWTNVPNGEYVLYAYAMYGSQRFTWIKQIIMDGTKTEVLLTNDGSCLIEIEED